MKFVIKVGSKYHPLTNAGLSRWFTKKLSEIRAKSKRRHIAATREVLTSATVNENSTNIVVFTRGYESKGLKVLKASALSKTSEYTSATTDEEKLNIIDTIMNQFHMFVSKRSDVTYEKLDKNNTVKRVQNLMGHLITVQKREEYLKKQTPKRMDELSDTDVAFRRGGGGESPIDIPGNIEMMNAAEEDVIISYFIPDRSRYLYALHKEMGGKVYEEQNGWFREVNEERAIRHVS